MTYNVFSGTLNPTHFEAASKLNEEACDDRPHLTPITGSIRELAGTY